MAEAPPGRNYVRIDSVNIWADSSGTIHVTTNDVQVKDRFHVKVNGNAASGDHHPAAYRQLAELLTSYQRDVPGWAPGEEVPVPG